MFTETSAECNTQIKHDPKDALKNNFHRKDAKNAKETGAKGKNRSCRSKPGSSILAIKAASVHCRSFAGYSSSVFLLFFAFFASLR
jgi:hypothetical protein